MDRYIRQIRFAPLGEEGQGRLSRARALVCGCGALGSMIANTLVRAGVGAVRIVDRDFVELSNLARQALFDEADAAAGLPKAVAAAEKLRRVNSAVEIEPIVADVNFENIEQLCDGMDVILDGTDNFETRFLLNDVAVKRRLPWIYGGCVGAEGQTMTIIPGETPCLRCLMETCPAPGSTPTCDTAGILGPIVGMIASIEAMEAIKICSAGVSPARAAGTAAPQSHLLDDSRKNRSRHLTVIDLWQNRIKQVDVSHLRDQVDCPTCKRGEFPWLSGREGSRTAVLCGRNAVQLSHLGSSITLDELAKRLASVGQITLNQYLLRLKVASYEITVFPDGRAIITGTDDISIARTIYAKYIGS